MDMGRLDIWKYIPEKMYKFIKISCWFEMMLLNEE